MKQRSLKVFAAVTLFLLIGPGPRTRCGRQAAKAAAPPVRRSCRPAISRPLADGRAIVVSWAQSVMSDGSAVEGYTVSKEDVIGGVGI